MGELPFFHHQAVSQQSRSPPASAFNHHPFNTSINTSGLPQANGDEEDYTIKCICQFQDDDGHTALCEQCNTWQHVDCYYYPEHNVPDVHTCVDCSPRPLPSGAFERQRRKRETQSTNEERRAKRSGPKNHRRSKHKETPSTNGFHTNGWSPSDDNNDRASGSPREQPPPSKRTKTHHRNFLLTSQSRPPSQRVGSSNGRIQFRPPLSDCPPDYFSTDFIRAHQDDLDFPLIGPGDSNEWSTLEMATEFSRWVDDPIAFDVVSNGKKQNEVFQRTEPEEDAAPVKDWPWPIRKETFCDESVQFHGRHPVWSYLVAEKSIEPGGFLGELIGTVGNRDEYISDPRNQWQRLRHPDHFVFFHPVLPIVFDCRRRGSLMRYLRRSCSPNLNLTTLVSGERDFHFCFTAARHIAEDEEVTVGWNTQFDRRLTDSLSEMAQGHRTGHSAYVTEWAGTILAHFGGCACGGQQEFPCLLGKFDHRLWTQGRELTMPKQHSPFNNKLDGNAARGDPSLGDDGGPDTEEAQSSGRSFPSDTSRDATPNTATSPSRMNGATEHEPSERERKKYLQTARLIEKIDHDKQHKKKRRSGSSVNTLLPSSTVQSRSKTSVSDPHTPATRTKSRSNDTGYFSVTVVSPQQLPASASPSERATSVLGGLPPTHPMYADVGVQTEPNTVAASFSPFSTQSRPYIPLSRRMLRRLHFSRARHAIMDGEVRVHEDPNYPVQAPNLTEGERSSQYVAGVEHVHSVMQGEHECMISEASEPLSPPKSPAMEIGNASNLSSGSVMLDDQTHRDNSDSQITTMPSGIGSSPQSSQRPSNLHVELPPPDFRSPNSDISVDTPSPATFSGTLQSPLEMTKTIGFAAPVAPMSAVTLPAGHSSLTQPSPVRKKMSLQDYSQRLKAKTPVMEKSQSVALSGNGSAPDLGVQQTIGAGKTTDK